MALGAMLSPKTAVMQELSHAHGALEKALESAEARNAVQEAIRGKPMLVLQDAARTVREVRESPLQVLKEIGRSRPFVKAMDTVEGELGPVGSALKMVYKGLSSDKFNAPPTLGGNPPETINRCVVLVFSGAACVLLSGVLLDLCKIKAMEGRPRFWALGLLVYSYLLLLPGLMNILLSFAIIANIIGNRVRVHPNDEYSSCTESTPELIKLLWDTGGKLGAFLLTFFAMVIPVVELVMLSVAEYFRFRNFPYCDRIARFSIQWVQHRSKWAAPDVFAYTLMLHLCREMNHPTLILTAAQLDVGFSCFSAFCVLATIGSLGFPLPPEQDSGKSDVASWRHQWFHRHRTTLLCGIFVAVVALTAAFSWLMVLCMTRPIMALRIETDTLFQPAGPLPLSVKPIVRMLNLERMLAADVTVLDTAYSLFLSARAGEANSAVGLAMWAIFAVGLTVVNVALCVLAWLRHIWCSIGVAPGELPPEPCPFLAVSRVVKKLAMLDVACVGIWLVTYCMGIYRDVGLRLDADKGLIYLFWAEVTHAIIYYVTGYTLDASALSATAYDDRTAIVSVDEARDGDLSCYSRTDRRSSNSRLGAE